MIKYFTAVLVLICFSLEGKIGYIKDQCDKEYGVSQKGLKKNYHIYFTRKNKVVIIVKNRKVQTIIFLALKKNNKIVIITNNEKRLLLKKNVPLALSDWDASQRDAKDGNGHFGPKEQRVNIRHDKNMIMISLIKKTH